MDQAMNCQGDVLEEKQCPIGRLHVSAVNMFQGSIAFVTRNSSQASPLHSIVTVLDHDWNLGHIT